MRTMGDSSILGETNIAGDFYGWHPATRITFYRKRESNMFPKTKVFPILSVLIVMFFSLGCVTMTRALEEITSVDFDDQSVTNPNDQEIECIDCDYWDAFEFDENDRPILSGEELILDTGHFRFHYTLTGRDAALSADYVNEMAQSFEYSWQVQIDQFGWAPPPPDNGIGGDERYDIYIQNIFADGTAGYTEGGEERYRGKGHGLIGDNPFTDAVETRAAASYIVMDNDYAELEAWAQEDGVENTDDPLEVMRSTVAHEFNHAIQFGYDGEEPADWLWEATATWMQDEVYDKINDADEDLLAVFKSPDTCQLAYGGEERVEDENHWYGEWIFIRYMSEKYGHRTIRSIWEYTRELDGYAAVEAALSDAGVTLDETFRDFSIALLTRSFEEGSRYPILRLEGEAQSESEFAPLDGVGQMAADYVGILANERISIELDAPQLEGILVGFQGGQASIFSMPNNRTSIDADHYGHVYLIVLNLEKADAEYDCEFYPYDVNISTGGQSTEPIEVIPAPNFAPPQIEPLLDPDEYWDEGFYEEVEPPAELLPAFLPAGYELIEAYQMSAEDYEYEYDADLIWYIPGGGTATVIDFYGPGNEDFIDITISESPYANLDEWLNDADYEPYDNELVTIGEQLVLLEDWTDEEYSPYSVATFIVNGQFIVVEGTLSAEELTKVIESLPVLP